MNEKFSSYEDMIEAAADLLDSKGNSLGAGLIMEVVYEIISELSNDKELAKDADDKELIHFICNNYGLVSKNIFNINETINQKLDNLLSESPEGDFFSQLVLEYVWRKENSQPPKGRENA